MATRKLLEDIPPRKELARTSKILLVEDSLFQRKIILEILKQQGFEDIEEAENGRVGLQKITDLVPDLVILDIEMPEMNGLEVCQAVRNDSKLEHIPLLVQTGRTNSEEKQEIFDSGASDYLAKPLDQKELIARVFSQLERITLLSQLSKFHSRVQEELETAAHTHRILFPNKELISSVKDTHGVDIHHFEQASSELGGDFWGIHPLSETQLIFYIVDFSGHGINAALNTFRLHTLMQLKFDKGLEPGEFLTELNSSLSSYLPSGQFATMFYGVLDTENSSLNYATAGCPTPFIFRKDANTEALSGEGFLLGALDNSDYETQSIPFSPGDMLLLYSDALTESPDKNGNVISEENIINFFQGKRQEEFEKFIKILKNKYDPSWPDDLTINAYYYK